MGLKIVFFGSPSEAVPALEHLVIAGHEVVAVYTQPDRAAGRSRRSRPTPVRAAAEALGIRVETPASLRDAAAQDTLEELGADLFVVVAYGRILPARVLAMPRFGIVNIHPSLLPKYRGPSPVLSAIRNGDSETGVTIMLLDEGMDTGPILLQSDPVPLVGDERTGALTARLFEIGADLLEQAITGLVDGSIEPKRQAEASATVTSLVQKDDGEVDWSGSAIEIERLARACDPWPGAFTFLDGKRLKLNSVAVSNELTPAGPPGTVTVGDRRVLVSTGNGQLELIEVQPEGKRAMSARDFINGTPGLDGKVLGQ